MRRAEAQRIRPLAVWFWKFIKGGSPLNLVFFTSLLLIYLDKYIPSRIYFFVTYVNQ